MPIIDRITTILRANINALLDQAEDPEAMLEQILRDMQSAIGDARGQVAQMIAQQRLLEADLQRAQSLAGDWENKASLAVQQNRDDLAREALRRRADFQSSAKLYEQQLDTQRSLVQKLKDDLQKLESKYDEALRRRDELIARHRRAQAQQKVIQHSQRFDVMDPTSELARMENRIRSEEAKASAMEEVQSSTLDAQFADLEKNEGIEAELERLKRQNKGQSATPPKSSGPAYPS